MNIVGLAGNLGRDPDTKYTQSGTMLCKLSLGVDQFVRTDGGTEQSTLWLTVTLFGNAAENAAKILHKGDAVSLTCHLQKRSWQQDGKNMSVLDIICDRWKKLSSGGNSSSGDYDFEDNEPEEQPSSGSAYKYDF